MVFLFYLQFHILLLKLLYFWHTINWDASPINRDYGRHYVYVDDKKDHHKHDMHKDQVQIPTLYSEFR